MFLSEIHFRNKKLQCAKMNVFCFRMWTFYFSTNFNDFFNYVLLNSLYVLSQHIFVWLLPLPLQKLRIFITSYDFDYKVFCRFLVQFPA